MIAIAILCILLFIFLCIAMYITESVFDSHEEKIDRDLRKRGVMGWQDDD